MALAEPDAEPRWDAPEGAGDAMGSAACMQPGCMHCCIGSWAAGGGKAAPRHGDECRPDGGGG